MSPFVLTRAIMDNVPDNWGSYYRHCDRCGGRYHASEGGCSCLDGLECQCGQDRWVDDPPYCKECGTGSYVRGNTHKTKHRARKPHGDNILAGDLYERTVNFGYYPNGAFTLRVNKIRLEKGPNWQIKEIMDG